MSFSLKPHPLIAHWVPGMVVLVLIVLSHFNWCYENFVNDWAGSTSAAAVTVLLLSVGAFLIGEVLDSARDGLIERLFDWIAERRRRCRGKVNWDYFFTLPPERTEQFNDYFFTYYVLNVNLVLALALSFVLLLLGKVTFPEGMQCSSRCLFLIIGGVCVLVLGWDAFALRREIARITWEEVNRVLKERQCHDKQTNNNVQ
jgi:hypothetical protein